MIVKSAAGQQQLLVEAVVRGMEWPSAADSTVSVEVRGTRRVLIGTRFVYVKWQRRPALTMRSAVNNSWHAVICFRYSVSLPAPSVPALLNMSLFFSLVPPIVEGFQKTWYKRNLHKVTRRNQASSFRWCFLVVFISNDAVVAVDLSRASFSRLLL